MRRGLTGGLAVAAAAMTLLGGAAGAAADELVVKDAASKGRGSFAAAVDRANAKAGPDEITFARSVRGEIRLPRVLAIEGPLSITGRGYGSASSRAFERVVLRGRLVDIERQNVLLRELFIAAPIDARSAQVSIRDSHLAGGGASGRAGIQSSRGGLKVFETTVTGFARGMELVDTNGRVVDSTVSRSTRYGGVTVAGGSVRISGSTISGNTFEEPRRDGFRAVGAGLWSTDDASVQVRNSTISGNVAEGEQSAGGGVFGETTLFHVTVSDNSAGITGGVASAVEGGPVTMGNSIVADNESRNGAYAEDCAGPFASLGGNLIESPGNCVGADLHSVDPLLGPLRDNGGPTRTQAIAKASPARGLAVKEEGPSVDQRGEARDAEPDAGAYELQP